MTPPIDGTCDPHFAPVREAFIANMAGDHEIGAAVAVFLDGKPVVDLWGGWRDEARTKPWERDTIVCMMSVTKAIAATCLLLLADRGQLDLEAPVARYWPEFAAHGKEAISVRMVLSQLASLPFADALDPGDCWDPDKTAAALAAQVPEWPPGSTPCYHSFTAGLLYQEIMRRADGRTIGRFLRETISAPFGIDFHIGLTDVEDNRRATFIPTPGTASWEGIKGLRPSPLNRAWRGLGHDEDLNSADWRFREQPSANGHGTARGAAKLYGALARGGEIDGGRLIGGTIIADAIRPKWDGVEAMTSRHFRYGTGYMLSCPPFAIGNQPANFGHPGIGGAVAFGDPVRRLGFAYAPNHMAPVSDAGPYASRLIDALYTALG